MSDITTVQNGESWKNERYFSTYEEAEKMKKSLKSSDKTGTYQYKIKRCGVGKSLYVVKSRIDPSMKAALEEIEEKMLRKKNTKKSKE